MFGILLSILTILATLSTDAPQPIKKAAVTTSTARPVYVQTFSVPTSWPISSSVDWVDQYTGTNMVRGTCRNGYKCIQFRYKSINSSWAAVTYGDVTCRSCIITIYLNPNRNYYSYYTKRSIVDHELGHANGITWHNSRCTSRMFAKVYCSQGKLPPRTFTTSEKSRLRAN